MFVVAHRLLGLLGYVDRHHSGGYTVSIILRVMCVVSTFNLLIPATWHIIVEVDTFAMRIATAMPLIIGVTNTVLYFAMLYQRAGFVSARIKLEQFIQKRMFFLSFVANFAENIHLNHPNR